MTNKISNNLKFQNNSLKLFPYNYHDVQAYVIRCYNVTNKNDRDRNVNMPPSLNTKRA